MHDSYLIMHMTVLLEHDKYSMVHLEHDSYLIMHMIVLLGHDKYSMVHLSYA